MSFSLAYYKKNIVENTYSTMDILPFSNAL